VTDETIIEAIERDWLDALAAGDVRALERIWDDSFVFTDPEGDALSREHCLREIAAGNIAFDSVELLRMQTRVFGDTAVVLGYVALEGRAGKRVYSGPYSFLDVYARAGDTWRAVLSSGERARPLLGAEDERASARS
jgi:ketosteroid isomerase-like protein